MAIQEEESTQEQQQQHPTAEERHARVKTLVEQRAAGSAIYRFLLSSIRVISVSPGAITFHLDLTSDHVNSRGGLHGAASATIVDFTTGLSISAWDLRSSTGASVDMHISYLSTAAAGETLEIVATAERVGGSLAYTTVRISKITEDDERKLVALGQHTKYVKGPGAAKVG